MKKLNYNSQQGFTLIELVLVIVMIGILSSVAVRKMSSTVEDARFEHTKAELDQLAYSIVGNPQAYSDGARVDYGYVGDIGALPLNLDALASNPGGYSSWAGPYIDNSNGNEFKKDAWQVDYVYSGTNIRSVGSGSNIDKVIISNSTFLLNNSVTGYVVDANQQPPGISFADSVVVQLTHPDGSGSTTTQSMTLSSSGNFSFNNIPIGNHLLEVIHLPATDTLSYQISVNPNSIVKLDIVFPADIF